MKSIDANSFGSGYHYKSRGQDVAVAVIVKILLLRGIPSTSIDTALSKGTVVYCFNPSISAFILSSKA